MAEKIDVDLDALREFRDTLHAAVTNDIRPNAIGIVRDCEPDIVNYGVRMATPAMTSARIRYHDSLARSLDNLRVYVNTTHALVAVVDELIASYSAADGVSADVAKQLLADATTEFNAARDRYEAAQLAAAHVDLPTTFMPSDRGMS